MRWSQLHIPTLRETPAEAASESVRLLLRAGYWRPQGWLALGRRSLTKVEWLFRNELAAGQEISLRQGGLSTALAGELRSYKQLPQTFWQVGESCQAWCLRLGAAPVDLGSVAGRVGAACAVAVEKARGIGGAVHFLIRSAAGDPVLARDPASGEAWVRSAAVAPAAPPGVPDPDGDLAPEAFATPDRKTIAEVCDFTGLPASSHIKSLVFNAGGQPVMALLRGDHTLSEPKLAAYLGLESLRPADPLELSQWLGAAAGSVGPVGVRRMRLVADLALQGRRNLICGANRDDYHLRNVTPGKDFQPEWQDLRLVEPGEGLEFHRAAEFARFATGCRGMEVLDPSGRPKPVAMDELTLFPERLLHAAAEGGHDAAGLILTPAIAPFLVVITPVNVHEPAQREAAERLYQACLAAGLDALLDDRDERPGVKFKDADLIGVPYRIVAGKKLAQGQVELVRRRAPQTDDVALDMAVARLRQEVGIGC